MSKKVRTPSQEFFAEQQRLETARIKKEKAERLAAWYEAHGGAPAPRQASAFGERGVKLSPKMADGVANYLKHKVAKAAIAHAYKHQYYTPTPPATYDLRTHTTKNGIRVSKVERVG